MLWKLPCRRRLPKSSGSIRNRMSNESPLQERCPDARIPTAEAGTGSHTKRRTSPCGSLHATSPDPHPHKKQPTPSTAASKNLRSLFRLGAPTPGVSRQVSAETAILRSSRRLAGSTSRTTDSSAAVRDGMRTVRACTVIRRNADFTARGSPFGVKKTTPCWLLPCPVGQFTQQRRRRQLLPPLLAQASQRGLERRQRVSARGHGNHHN